MLLSEHEVGLQAISVLELVEPVVVIDLTERRALLAGATAALSAGLEYGESQGLASRLQGEVDGLRWRVRHDLAQQLIGIAFFGPRGPQPDDYLRLTSTGPIGRGLIRAAEDAFGYRVVPAP